MLKFFYNLSLKGKLHTIILVSGVFLLGLVFAALFINEVYNSKRNLESDLITLADIMGSNGSIGLAFQDIKATEDTLASLSAKPGITQAHVFDQKGELFASYIRGNYVPTSGAAYAGHLKNFYYSSSHRQVFPSPDEGNKSNGPKEENDFFVPDAVFFEDEHVDVFKLIQVKERKLGTVYMQSDLHQINQRLFWYGLVMLVVMLASLIPTLLLSTRLQRAITKPLYSLLRTMNRVSDENNYNLRAVKPFNDEIGKLIDDFNNMLAKVQQRDEEINQLNQQLAEENRRMSAELGVARQLQLMVLPKDHELKQSKNLDIAAFMEAAEEVGGDYYDILYDRNGQIKIGIGDVTGHGLESGVVMLMVQMAVRTLLLNNVNEPQIFLDVVNRALFENVKRMDTDKNLTLSLVDYKDGKLTISGQHEEVLVIRKGGEVERIDTADLGFMIGLTEDISEWINQCDLELAVDDGVLLYTDGVTEARNPTGDMYGVERLCDSFKRHWDEASSQKVQEKIIADLRAHIADEKVYDDITVVVLRRLA